MRPDDREWLTAALRVLGIGVEWLNSESFIAGGLSMRAIRMHDGRWNLTVLYRGERWIGGGRGWRERLVEAIAKEVGDATE